MVYMIQYKICWADYMLKDYLSSCLISYVRIIDQITCCTILVNFFNFESHKKNRYFVRFSYDLTLSFLSF